MTITGVRGLNDNPALGKPAAFTGNCTTCHDTPNVGDHSLPLPLDIGVGHAAQPGFETDPNIAAGLAELDEPNLPVFLVGGCPTPFSAVNRSPSTPPTRARDSSPVSAAT